MGARRTRVGRGSRSFVAPGRHPYTSPACPTTVCGPWARGVRGLRLVRERFVSHGRKAYEGCAWSASVCGPWAPSVHESREIGAPAASYPQPRLALRQPCG